jgi:hypothetical protein
MHLMKDLTVHSDRRQGVRSVYSIAVFPSRLNAQYQTCDLRIVFSVGLWY